MELHCTRNTRLRSLTADDAALLLAILDTDRSAFDPWLRWSSGVVDLATATEFIATATQREAVGNGFHLGLWRGEALLGGVPCWSINPVTRTAELGYWLALDARGSGLAAQATRVVMDYLFTAQDVDRVEFQCLVENTASRRLAERLGGTLQRIHRPSVLVRGKPRDHAVYAILAQDHRAGNARA